MTEKELKQRTKAFALREAVKVRSLVGSEGREQARSYKMSLHSRESEQPAGAGTQ